ncbi:MAG: glutamyl-tRNA reductase, partial [Thiotrichales bacterium]|nr:glutamyl-tRNA reductase [Thiotrichales bacterium]MBT5983595.1 glutamyl-tRNA reductase [Thiotrichales bacterium]MBT6771524.1 glutamyl-tRNA reductase [Thiotrichales bacterium]MBT7934412.1 glutamyl-tRNA reductase [Thiotrichales bacterium]
VIKNYRRQANLLKDELLQIALRKLKSGSSPDLVVEELADKLTNKLLHQSLENITKPSKSKENKANLVDQDTKKRTKIGN